MVKEKVKEENKQEGKYSIADVATQTEPRVFDGEKTYTIEEALVLVLNKVDDMQKKIIG